ncbi:uracil-DNA glycosylase [Craterilacuibacter sp. RT1T]|uniref:uracil-DNA glycosylase n=1 Tax=Craterilacuibacter sp. RT1T TaxID=2942211 RepID=UPI0020BEDB94|nr:uracil-DNA glycosylase [Craterilacuibacter sp. RT1T]MCL6261939.1 uracil-DNA glycosylase [Craterilacuibacter sp. RT1T]
MSRRLSLVEAMGLGPLWQRREVEYVYIDSPAIETAPVLQAEVQAASAPAATIAPTAPPPSTTPPTVLPLDAVALNDTKNLQGLSLSELKAKVARCQDCRLSNTRNQTVFGSGNPQARWLFIGEAPGENEDLQGEAFVGAAGMLLNNILQAAGLDRERDVYITNILKCRPPINRNPQVDEVAACQVYLAAQIALLKPELIVTLGRFASQTLLQSKASIGQLRGQVHHYQGIPLIASLHPAYLLRNPQEKAAVWRDLLLAKKTLQTSNQS